MIVFLSPFALSLSAIYTNFDVKILLLQVPTRKSSCDVGVAPTAFIANPTVTSDSPPIDAIPLAVQFPRG